MANDSICVFCGQKPGTFRSTTVACGSTVQVACKACEKELKDLDEIEVCRRALIRGIAENPERIRERIELITEAENHRPKCLRCRTNLTFMDVQELDNTPMQDSVFWGPLMFYLLTVNPVANMNSLTRQLSGRISTLRI